MGKVCAFFGHHDFNEQKEYRPLLEKEIIRLIEQENVDTFYVGEHGNFESFAYRIVLDIKEKYPHIQVILVIAYVQDLHKTGRYMDSFIYPNEAEFAPRRFAITHRNRYIVQNTDFVICNINFEYGGAYNAAKYAMNQGKKVINLQA